MSSVLINPPVIVMSDYICHDFKTPRTDTSKRLPNSYKLIPVLFYVALLGGAYFMSMDYMAYKRSQQEKIAADALLRKRSGMRTVKAR